MKNLTIYRKMALPTWPWLLAVLLLAGLLYTGCDSSGEAQEEPAVPVLRVTTVTTGNDLDTDGYTVTINGTEEVTIGVNETVTLSQITSGSHQLDLAGVDANCAPESTTHSVTVTGPTEVTFAVACSFKGRIAFMCSQGGGFAWNICVMRPDGSERVQLRQTGQAFQPAFSPDGSKIVFVGGGGILWVRDAVGGEPTQLTPNLALQETQDPSWSRDGSKIAFSARPTDVNTGEYLGTRDIYVMNADGSNIVNLTNSDALWYAGPTWSPDGSQLVVVGSGVDPALQTTESEWGDLYVMNADGTHLRNITAGTPQASLVGPPKTSWSPVDSRILFTAAPTAALRFAEFRVYMIDANGANLELLTNAGSQGAYPSWRPDGEWIVYSGEGESSTGGSCDRGGTLGVMRPDGSEKQFISGCAMVEQSASWTLGEGE